MEVDRVGRMGPLASERTPAWTREKLRRRRFVSEVEPEVQDESDEAASGQENDPPEPKPDLDIMA
ncbi:MAG: hypothetical protein WBW84_06510 [Acidobacteriaceae bacterium]